MRCATGWVGRHRSVEVVIPRSLTDVKQGYQGPSDERRNGHDPAHAQRSRPGSIDVEGLWLENQFSKRRPMSQVRCEFSAGHRTGGVNAEARWPPLDPELVRRATGTTGGFSCARRMDGNGASKSLASWIGELTIGPVLSRSMVTDATEWLRAA